jgi:hypothetical protein
MSDRLPPRRGRCRSLAYPPGRLGPRDAKVRGQDTAIWFADEALESALRAESRPVSGKMLPPPVTQLHSGPEGERVARKGTLTETGLQYRPDEPVLVRIVRREHRLSVTDDGAAIAMAGRVAGWRAVADRIARESDVNVSRQGVVSLPVVAVGPGLEAIVQRIADASLAFYQELLELRY